MGLTDLSLILRIVLNHTVSKNTQAVITNASYSAHKSMLMSVIFGGKRTRYKLDAFQNSTLNVSFPI